MLNYDTLPSDVVDTVRGYIEHGRQPGGFMLALLSNDLKETMKRADDRNRRRVFELVAWFYNEAPAGCQGSPEKVQIWLTDADHRNGVLRATGKVPDAV